MPNKLETVSILLDRDIYRNKAQVKRVLAQRGMTTRFGIQEQSARYWRVPQSDQPMNLDSFETGKKVRGMRAIRAERAS